MAKLSRERLRAARNGVRARSQSPRALRPQDVVVVFDVGGVLIHWDDRWVMDRAAQKLRVPAEDLHRLMAHYRPMLQTGRIDVRGFWDRIGRDLSRRIPRPVRELWWKALEKQARPQQEVLRWAAELRRAGFRTALFSNTDPSHRRYFARPWSRGFTPRLLSYDLRAVKPDPRAFRRARLRLGVPPTSILLLDDLPQNVRAARQAGWHAHLYRGIGGAEEALVKAGWIVAKD